LPIGDPFVDSFEDPLILKFHLAFLVIYLVGLTLQIRWLKSQPAS